MTLRVQSTQLQGMQGVCVPNLGFGFGKMVTRRELGAIEGNNLRFCTSCCKALFDPPQAEGVCKSC